MGPGTTGPDGPLAIVSVSAPREADFGAAAMRQPNRRMQDGPAPTPAESHEQVPNVSPAPWPEAACHWA
jgi:hypothetical protein